MARDGRVNFLSRQAASTENQIRMPKVPRRQMGWSARDRYYNGTNEAFGTARSASQRHRSTTFHPHSSHGKRREAGSESFRRDRNIRRKLAARFHKGYFSPTQTQQLSRAASGEVRSTKIGSRSPVVMNKQMGNLQLMRRGSASNTCRTLSTCHDREELWCLQRERTNVLVSPSELTISVP